jgi:hypothetical protein
VGFLRPFNLKKTPEELTPVLSVFAESINSVKWTTQKVSRGQQKENWKRRECCFEPD